MYVLIETIRFKNCDKELLFQMNRNKQFTYMLSMEDVCTDSEYTFRNRKTLEMYKKEFSKVMYELEGDKYDHIYSIIEVL